MITDALGNEIFYWPISNLAEGENSETLVIRVPTPSTGYLKASNDSRTKVWAKWLEFPSNPFTEISTGIGINLSGIDGPYGEFEIYVEALVDLDEGFARVPLSIIAAEGVGAGWTN